MTSKPQKNIQFSLKLLNQQKIQIFQAINGNIHSLAISIIIIWGNWFKIGDIENAKKFLDVKDGT